MVDPSTLTNINEDPLGADTVLDDEVEEEDILMDDIIMKEDDIMKDIEMMKEVDEMMKDILVEEVFDDHTVDFSVETKIVSKDNIRLAFN